MNIDVSIINGKVLANTIITEKILNIKYQNRTKKGEGKEREKESERENVLREVKIVGNNKRKISGCS